MTAPLIDIDAIKPFSKWEHPILTIRLWLNGYKFKKTSDKELALMCKTLGSQHQFKQNSKKDV